MQMAVNAFENYSWSPHSRLSLIQTLESFGFSLEDSRYAVYAIDVDWNSTAEFYAQEFLGWGIGYSKQTVIAMLRVEEYTLAEANHGVNAIGADWVQKAIDRGREHIYGHSSDGTRYTRSRMITLLTSAGFTQSEATQAVDSDYIGEGTWVSEAISKAYDMYYAGDPGDAGLVSALVAYGFTPAQARQAADEIQVIRPPSED
jgi:Holliday junction resolvasome RuvABC DNA-binding subunit